MFVLWSCFFPFFFLFFFFQAEDGIRDWSVTGVQTCALPISGVRRRLPLRGGPLHRADLAHRFRGFPPAHAGSLRGLSADGARLAAVPDEELRSEEHTSELQSLTNLVCRLLLEKKKKNKYNVP